MSIDWFGQLPPWVLGAVSQSGGVPTGGLIERGSNANGEYVRLADGTQICWVQQSITPVANTWTTASGTWPAAFSAVPNAVASAASTAWGNTLQQVNMNSYDATTYAFGVYRTNTTATSVRCIAVGRWF